MDKPTFDLVADITVPLPMVVIAEILGVDSENIAFGFGIHFCVGAPLARLEAKVMLEVMLERLGPCARVEADVSWVPSFFMRAPRKLVLARRDEGLRVPVRTASPSQLPASPADPTL